MRLMQACLCPVMTRQSRFNKGVRAVKHVEACLHAWEDRESSFHHCGSPVRLVHARLCAGKT